MSGALGSLNISLLLETVQFQQEMTKSAYLLNKQVGDMVGSVNAAGAKITGVLKGIAAAAGTALTVDAFAGMINGAIETQAQLGILAEKAGMTGAQLSSLSAAARFSGTSMADTAAISAKLSKALVDAQVDTSKQASVLRALGITAAETKQMLANPAEGLFLLSKRLQNFAVDGNLSAATMLLIGKSAQDAIPFLNELAKQHELVATKTNEQIKAAREYEDKLTAMAMRSDALKAALANALLPTMSGVLDAFVKGTTGAGNLKEKIDLLAADGSIKEWARDTALVIGTLAESLIALGRVGSAVFGSFQVAAADMDVMLAQTGAPKTKITGTLGFTPEEAAAGNAALDAALARRNAILAQANQRYEDLWTKSGTFITDALRKQFAASDAAARSNPGTADRQVAVMNAAAAAAKKPSLTINLDNAGAQDTMRKQLEGQVKILDEYIRQEAQLLSQREQWLSRFYSDGLIGIHDYFAGEAAARDEALQKTNVYYAGIVAMYEGFAKAAKKPADAIAFLDKAHETSIKWQEAQSAALQKTQLAYYDEAKAVRDYADSVIQTQAAIANAQGKGGAFVGPLFDIQHRTDMAKAVSNNDPAQVANLNALKAIEEAKGRINDLDGQAAIIQTRLATAEGYANLAQTSGAQTELQTLAQQGVARRRAAEQLAGVVAEYQKVAEASGDPRMIANAEAWRLKLEELKVSADALGKKFQDIFENNFADALTSVIDGTKSVKAAFSDMARSITHDLAAIASKQIANAILGQNGELGGIGGWIGALFAGGSTAPAAASGWTNGFDLAGAADGGHLTANVPYEVGERGREVFVPDSAGTIVPNHMLGGGKTIKQTINYTSQGRQTRASQAQIASDIYTGTMRAAARIS